MEGKSILTCADKIRRRAGLKKKKKKEAGESKGKLLLDSAQKKASMQKDEGKPREMIGKSSRLDEM